MSGVPLAVTLSARGALPRYDLISMREFGVEAFVTGRHGGVSAAPYDELNLAEHVGDDPVHVGENRRRVAASLGLDASRLVTSTQVHGAVANDVDHWRGESLVGDALVTTRRDVALAVLVADCVPLLIVEPATGRLAVVHAGWRGLVAGVIPTTLAYFASAHEVRVAIGPHISRVRYQVGPDVAAHFDDVVGACLEDEADRRRLDLGVVVAHQLRVGGVLEDHVTSCALVTDGGGEFYSDRAQRPSGRFALVARRSPHGVARREDRP